MSEMTNDNRPLRILLAAGGSGGHLFPAFALAEHLIHTGAEVRVVTDPRGARFKGEGHPFEIDLIDSATLEPGLLGKFKTVYKLAKGVLQSVKLIRSFKPDVVIGFGGYPAFPPIFAAQKMGIKTVLHEANAVLGKANKMLAKKATKIAVSLPKTKGVSEIEALNKKAVVTGNPVRAEIITKKNAPYPKINDTDEIRLFIMGGSQGARIFSDVIPEAVKRLPEHLQKRLKIIQQCRPEDLERANDAFSKTGAKAELKTFFDDVPDQLSNCHLFIGRSGASTVSEVAIIGRPAIFIPLRHADMQQKVNADVIADVGGGWVMMQEGFTPEALATRLETLLSLEQNLEKAAQKAASVGQPEATKKLAKLIRELI